MSVKNAGFVRLLAIPGLVWAFMLLACGGGGKADAAASPGPLSGNWQIVLQQDPADIATKTEAGFFVQSGNSLTGSVLLSGQTLCPGLGSAQGTVSGTSVSLTVNQIAQTVNLTGTTGGNGSSMSGTYAILASGCGGGSTTGTWTASQVKPLSGSFMTTFTSGDQTSLVYDFAVMLTQGPNTGSSNATLAGTMTSTNAPCGNTFTVAGVVGGTSVVFNFLAADGSAVGQFRGATTTDGTMLTGTYDFLAQTNGCSGDAGTAAITLQH